MFETDDVNCKDADLCAVGYILNAIQVPTTNVTKIARMGYKNDSIKEPRPLLIEFLSENYTYVVVNKSHVFNSYPLCQGIWIKSSYSLEQHNHTKSQASERKQSPSNRSKKTPPPFINPFANFGLQKPQAAPKEINILVIGQTGVGKSTWINGIANYMIENVNSKCSAFIQILF
jgi:ribosome biogenesis GTPase A